MLVLRRSFVWPPTRNEVVPFPGGPVWPGGFCAAPAGADRDLQGARGRTALDMAKGKNDAELVKLLEEGVAP